MHLASYIARQFDAGRKTVGAAELAEAQGLALDYTQQVLHRLRDGGVLSSVRGPNGGYCLSRKAQEISLLDILLASEGESFEVMCETRPLSEHRCAPEVHCGIRHVWYGLREHVNEYLRGYSLADLAKEVSSEESLVKINSKPSRASAA